MKKLRTPWLVAFAVLGVCSCAITRRNQDSLGPQTVFASYRVKHGAEKELEGVLAETWHVYRMSKMVNPNFHVCLRVLENEREATYYYVQIFQWLGPFAAEHPPKDVKDCWARARELCESRHGAPPVEFRDAQITHGSPAH